MHVNIMPMAGEGKRFLQGGYKTPKPFIKLMGKEMFLRSFQYFPPADKNVFIVNSYSLVNIDYEGIIKNNVPDAVIVDIGKLSEGQAITVLSGLKVCDDDDSVFIGSCDNGLKFDEYHDFKNDFECDSDCLVYCYKPNIINKNNATSFGWVKMKPDFDVKLITCKNTVGINIEEDYVLCGSFYFKTKQTAVHLINKLVKSKITVNNEYYMDSAMSLALSLGQKVKAVIVRDNLSWGTPDELKANIA